MTRDGPTAQNCYVGTRLGAADDAGDGAARHSPTRRGALSMPQILSGLVACVAEHRRCGVLDGGGVDNGYVW
jgi:hypothetical protein